MKEVKEKILKEIYLNVLKAIIIIFYFFILNLAYENTSAEHIELGIKIFTMIFLFIAIYIFEKAYKKDNDNLAIQGIEILVLSAYTLTSRHITNKFNFDFRTYSLVASYIFAIYFILKCIVIYTKGRKEEVENLSDIREIVKKDEPVKKEATKKIKEDNAKNIQDKKTEKKEETKKETTTKKKERNAKKEIITKNNEKNTKKETTAKKKTTNTRKTETRKKKEITPKKTEAKVNTDKKQENKKQENKKQENKKQENKKQENEKPKRKRVKKEVKEND